MFSLGQMNERGLGGVADPVQAYKWYALAVRYIREEEGPFRKTAEAVLQAMRSTLSPDQMAEADKLVKEWQPPALARP